jgi:RHS repeat-associated protein
METKDKLYYYHNDINGAPLRLTDEAGNIVWNVQYDIFGKIDKISKNEIANPIRMQGQYEDEETGLYYNRYRYYDPNISAYVSQDPLRLRAGINLYSYGVNSFGWIDPLGLSCETSFDKEVKISKSKYPESAKHIEEAQANGHSEVLTIDRGGAKQRRAESLKNTPTVKDMDRDEYPPAMFKEGGTGASVKHIPSSDNRGAGSSIGHELRNYPDGTKVKISTID